MKLLFCDSEVVALKAPDQYGIMIVINWVLDNVTMRIFNAQRCNIVLYQEVLRFHGRCTYACKIINKMFISFFFKYFQI